MATHIYQAITIDSDPYQLGDYLAVANLAAVESCYADFVVIIMTPASPRMATGLATIRSCLCWRLSVYSTADLLLRFYGNDFQ